MFQNVYLCKLLHPIPILVYMESVSRVTKNESLGMFSFYNFDKRSSVFFTKLSCPFPIGFKWESIWTDGWSDQKIHR